MSTVVRTLSGKSVDLLDPDPSQIDITDITRALSNLCRYGGRLRCFYSVAEHSVLVANWLLDRHRAHLGGNLLALAGLLHDGAEAYMGDIPWPVRAAISGASDLDDRLSAIVAKRFGLSHPWPEEVKEADYRIVADEEYLMPVETLDWTGYVRPERLGVYIECWSPEKAEHEFLRLYEFLSREARV